MGFKMENEMIMLKLMSVLISFTKRIMLGKKNKIEQFMKSFSTSASFHAFEPV